MLHIISNINPSLLNRIHHNDAVIFLENAVLGLLKNSRYQEKLSELKTLYVLNEHLKERGILKEEILEHITIIDYARFVELTIEHHPIHSWT
ncbi:Protein TusB [Patescibacteria group bacterium]|nr:Protein TusB [Patescibacteria group bacterium]